MSNQVVPILGPEIDETIELSIVIPTYNERENLSELTAKICSVLDTVLPGRYELIVVDDDSPDLTWQLAGELAREYKQLRVIRRTEGRGFSSAVIRGWQEAQAPTLGVIDADLQHPPEVLLKLVHTAKKGIDLVVASRNVEGGGVSDWSIFRRFVSRGAQLYGLLVLPDVLVRVRDPMSGYFLVQRSCIAGIPLNPLGYKILVEVIARGNIQSIAEVGYVFRERKQGNSKATIKQYMEYIRHILRLRLGRKINLSQLARSFQLHRFCAFSIVGLSGVVVDTFILFVLSDPVTLGFGLTRSKIVAAEVAIFNNFIWNDLWTFRDLAKNQPGWSSCYKRFLKFNVICFSGLILNVVILNVLFNLFSVNRYIANLTAILIVSLWNFFLNVQMSWRVTETASD
jgi:dolichol-phosphate mannosyltransferase